MAVSTNSFVKFIRSHLHLTTFYMLIFTFMLLNTEMSSAAPPKCRDLPSPVNVTEQSCINGVVIDWCNRPICGKGPGEACGGRWNEFGQCGKGMFCGCDVCQGCNKRVECFLRSKC